METQEERMQYLEQKRKQVLEAIKPICEAFKIDDYDYAINESGQTETLRIYDVRIGCSCNSVSAVINELVGFIFIRRWCKDRYLGTFSTQTKNVIKEYWLQGDK